MEDDRGQQALEAGVAWYEGTARASARFLLIVAAFAVISAALIALRVVVLPLAFAIVLASVLAAPVRWLRDRGLGPATASAVLLGLGVLTTAVVTAVVVRSVVAQWDSLKAALSQGLDELETAAQEHLDLSASQTQDVRGGVDSAGDTISDLAVHGVLTIVPATIEVLSSVFLTWFILFFILKDGGRLWAWVIGQFPSERGLLDRTGGRVWAVLARFMRGTTIIAVIDACGIGLGMWIIGVPFAGAIMVLTFLFAYIPMVGATISGGFGVLLAVSEGGLELGLAALAVVLAVQQLEGQVLQPFIMGRAVRLHPLVIALGLVLGATFAGIVGMFLAVPLAAATAVAISELRAAGVFGPTRRPGAVEADLEPA